MRQVNRTVAVLFLAASSVCAAQVSGLNLGDASAPVNPAIPASPVSDVATSQPANPVPPGGNIFGNGAASDAGEVIPVNVNKDKAGETYREGAPLKPGQVNVSETGTVEIHVADASVVEVLRMLGAQSQKNIIISKDVHGPVTANLYDVTMKEALDAILPAYGFGYIEKGNFVYVYTAKEIQDIEKATRRTQTEVIRLFYTPAANAVTMIKPVLSSEGQVAVTTPSTAGIASSASDTGGNNHASDEMMVVTDYPENLERIRQVVKEIDRRPQQILVEATILRASLSDDNALGVDFNVLAGANFTSALTSAGQLLNSSAGSSTGSSGSGSGSGSQFTNNGPQSVNFGRGVGALGTGNNFTNGINNGLRVGFVSDNVSVFVAALEAVTDTTVLANPKILALNRQKGEVVVGRKDGYLTTTVTSSSSTQTVDFLETGTRLIFRPYIGDDGYIRMEIHPEDSSGGITSSANLPFKITTEVTSNILIKDGRTVVIGGLFRESSESSKNQVPLLGSIPIAGQLFKNQRDRTTRDEVIILLTPHIIKDEDGYAKESEAAQKDFDRLRVGVRRGMMPSGRSQLAESAYQKAVEELNKPNPDRSKALWHLNIATNLNPKFIEAIELREKITGVELQSVDNSSVRGFVKRRVLAERYIAPATQPSFHRVVDPQPQATTPAAVGTRLSDATPPVDTTPAHTAPVAAQSAPTEAPVAPPVAPPVTPAPAVSVEPVPATATTPKPAEPSQATPPTTPAHTEASPTAEPDALVTDAHTAPGTPTPATQPAHAEAPVAEPLKPTPAAPRSVTITELPQ